MVYFIAMHSLSFQEADHLSDLFQSMFPDSAIVATFAGRYTKSKAVLHAALDPH